MKQILWFRRDLRINDNEILANAEKEVLPIFIFDKNILNKLSKDDKRINFIYQSVLKLKNDLKSINLDLKIYYDEPINVFKKLKDNFDEVLCSCDYESYSVNRDIQIEKIIKMKRFYDSYLINPGEGLKPDKTPYTVFTPFYKSLNHISNKSQLEEFKINKDLKLTTNVNYDVYPFIEDLGFIKQELDGFLKYNPQEILTQFIHKIDDYSEKRDYFYMDGTSNLGIFLRFGNISPRQVFNYIKRHSSNNDTFIKELFWREFWAYILLHFPESEKSNFNGLNIKWKEDKELFNLWCQGKTGVPIIDSAMIHFNNTGIMHNRLRMIVASFLTKNLFLPWQWGEKYFASKLLDYDASSNIGSWQWSASTGADGSPYFRVFNPYTQSQKFDKDGIFIKSVLSELKDQNPKLFHFENGLQNNLFVKYPKSIVDIKETRVYAIKNFK